MGTHFTDKEIAVLAANPNTGSVTETTLRFTPEFREVLWTRYKLGERPADVFKEAGYDLELVGHKRIENTIYLIRKQKRSGQRKAEASKGRKKTAKASDAEYELKYLRQENEFLKKLYLLETGKPYTTSK